MVTKSLVKHPALVKYLHEVNHREVKELNKLMESPAAVEAILNFMQRKKKARL